jgi:hypothetical protein
MQYEEASAQWPVPSHKPEQHCEAEVHAFPAVVHELVASG